MSHITPRKATIPIYQGDDLERLGELRRAADIAERHAKQALEEAKDASKGEDRRAGDDDPLVEARGAYEATVKPTRDAYDAFVEEAAERACLVEIQAIGSKRFRELRLAHEPRKVTVEVPADPDDPESVPESVEQTHEDDLGYDVNTETFPRALLTYLDDVKRTIAAPGFESVQEIEDFLDDEVDEGDIPRLWTTAYMLNKAVGADPKASRFSIASQSSPAI